MSNITSCQSSNLFFIQRAQYCQVLLGNQSNRNYCVFDKMLGGRVSDKHLTTECGFLRKLLPGDMVLADRAFDIADELALCGV